MGTDFVKSMPQGRAEKTISSGLRGRKPLEKRPFSARFRPFSLDVPSVFHGFGPFSGLGGAVGQLEEHGHGAALAVQGLVGVQLAVLRGVDRRDGLSLLKAKSTLRVKLSTPINISHAYTLYIIYVIYSYISFNIRVYSYICILYVKLDIFPYIIHRMQSDVKSRCVCYTHLVLRASRLPLALTSEPSARLRSLRRAAAGLVSHGLSRAVQGLEPLEPLRGHHDIRVEIR